MQSEFIGKAGDKEYLVFKELFDKQYMPLCVYSFKYCDSYAMSEDIVQTLFLKVWDEKLFQKISNGIVPYLYKSVKNNTLQQVKKNTKFYFTEIEELANKALEEDEFELSAIDEEKSKLLIEIERLPEKCKAVFKAIVLQDMKYKEVADHLNISINTVKTHYSRALKQLRNSLDVIIMLLYI